VSREQLLRRAERDYFPLTLTLSPIRGEGIKLEIL